MATAWQTLEEAALTLGISSRTLHRRISKGEFQTRLEAGRREVLVSIPDPVIDSQTAQSPGCTSAASIEQMTDTDSQLSADVQATMLMLHEDRIRRTDLAIMAYQQSVNVSAMNARRAAVSSRVAWSTAGGLAAILFVSVVWATHRVTKAEADVTNLNGQVKQMSATTDLKNREADRLRLDVEIARVAAARSEGELAAARMQVDQLQHDLTQVKAQSAASTTRPSEPSVKSDNAVQARAVTGVAPATQPVSTTQPISAIDKLLVR